MTDAPKKEKTALLAMHLPISMLAKIDIIAKKDGFTNRADFAREAIANEIDARML